jgi:hypothetical protein
LARLDETGSRKLGGCSKSVGGIVPIECAAKARVRGRLRCHEHMFPRPTEVRVRRDADPATRARAFLRRAVGRALRSPCP